MNNFKTSKKLPSVIFLLVFVFLFVAFSRIVFMMIYQQEFSFSVLSAEIFPPPHIGGVSKSYIYGVINSALFFSFLVFWIVGSVHNRDEISIFLKENLYKRLCFPIFVILYFLITFSQTCLHAQYFQMERMDYLGKTLEQKQEMIFQFAYTFARAVRQKIPGEHIAEIVTDLDLQRSAEMTLHRQLCYFLYPINVRSHMDNRSPDVLIYLGKKNAMKAIPSEYEIIHRYDDENMVALRKTGNSQ